MCFYYQIIRLKFIYIQTKEHNHNFCKMLKDFNVERNLKIKLSQSKIVLGIKTHKILIFIYVYKKKLKKSKNALKLKILTCRI